MVVDVLLAHPGVPLQPHDLWMAWNLDPVLVGGIGVAVWIYRRGELGRRERAGDALRRRCFAGGVAAVTLALVTPLDALSGALASAHMVQHLLLVLVAAPLLALSAPSAALLRGSPPVMRRANARWRRRLKLTRSNLRFLRHPATVWLFHVAALWVWHASVPYGAALDNELVHILEHATFLVTALLFWRVVVGSRSAGRVSNGLGVMLVFATAMQSTFLALLLTFAERPWYEGYAQTTSAWGLDPLSDQQLAGVIMWIPAGLVYTAAGLALATTWIRQAEDDEMAPAGAPVDAS